MTQDHAVVIGGVDTHKDFHVAAVIDQIGTVLGTAQFEVNPKGYSELWRWMSTFGDVVQVGVEGTGCYGAGLAHFLTGASVDVLEVNRPNRQIRRRKGKSDTVDAEAAARAVLNGEATGTPKAMDGVVESIRVLRVAFTTARRCRTQVANQIRDLIITAPEDLRCSLEHLAPEERITRCARFHQNGEPEDPRVGTKLALRSLAKRFLALSAEMTDLQALLDDLTSKANPALKGARGVGTDTAAILLVAAGDNPERLKSEASFAALCGVSPVQASSGKTTRHRLNSSGNRQANHALWRIVRVRMLHDDATKSYVKRRTEQGRSDREIVRCLKRYVAREVFHLLVDPMSVPNGSDLRAYRLQLGLKLVEVAEALRTSLTKVSNVERGASHDCAFSTTYLTWLESQAPQMTTAAA